MQVGLYYLSMFLLLNNANLRSQLSSDEIAEIETMAPYVAIHYLPWMLCAKYPTRCILFS